LIGYAGAAYMFNNLTENLANKRPVFDPVGLIEDYYKSEEKTGKSLVGIPGIVGRPESKSYITDKNIGEKVLDAYSAIGRAGEITDLPIFAVFADALPTLGTIFMSDKTDRVKLETFEDAVIKTAASVVKGGNQARKTISGLQAAGGVYVDPKYLNEKNKIDFNDAGSYELWKKIMLPCLIKINLKEHLNP
jgi:hypothetical protein